MAVAGHTLNSNDCAFNRCWYVSVCTRKLIFSISWSIFILGNYRFFFFHTFIILTIQRRRLFRRIQHIAVQIHAEVMCITFLHKYRVSTASVISMIFLHIEGLDIDCPACELHLLLRKFLKWNNPFRMEKFSECGRRFCIYPSILIFIIIRIRAK